MILFYVAQRFRPVNNLTVGGVAGGGIDRVLLLFCVATDRPPCQFYVRVYAYILFYGGGYNWPYDSHATAIGRSEVARRSSRKLRCSCSRCIIYSLSLNFRHHSRAILLHPER